ncbi:MAG: MSCRAMM family adhesin SdrC [Acidobacteria bacterium]|nr:MSCRAMM family adhesin SdrC [Acidobacteriota bacterium]
MKPLVARGAGILAVIALVAACGGGGGDSADEVAAEKCADVPAAELAVTGALCSDTGLRPVDGGFSFENWGGPVKEDAVTVTTAIAIFGEDGVCAQTTDAGCIPFPAVQHWIDSSNSQIAGGRCEGMAVLSQRIHDGGDAPSQLQEQAARTADLKKETLPVAASISRWWVSQGFEPVIQATNQAWQLEPSEVVAKIDAAIKANAGATIGIYANGMGHAVTPIAVTIADDGKYAISVYDNNYPGKVTVLTVDPATETWSYDVGAANSAEAASTWSGGKSTIDYVVMADREGMQKVPWSDNDRAERSKGSARITVSTGGKSVAGLIINVGTTTIDTRDLSTVSNGIAVYPNRGGIGTGAMVEIPDGLADVKIKPVVGKLLDPTVMSVDLAVSVDAPGPGSQLITDTVEGDDLTSESYDDFSLTVSTDQEFENALEVAPDGEIEVGVAYEEEAAEVTLEDGQSLSVVDDGGDAGLAIEVATADGEVVYEAGFDGTSDTGEIGVANVDIDEATGEVSVEVEAVEPEAVNEEILAVTAADEPTANDPNPSSIDGESPSDDGSDSTNNGSTDSSGGDDNSGTSGDGGNDDTATTVAGRDSDTSDDAVTTTVDDDDRRVTTTTVDDDDDSPSTTARRSTTTTEDDERDAPTTTESGDDN